MLVSADLTRDRYCQHIGMLRTFIAENPLSEELYRLLMLVLYRSERRADALAVYRDARKVLRAELGLEPCRALRDLQRSILAADSHDDLHLAAL
jgi:DNA-binding SARP family transcriptional activator